MCPTEGVCLFLSLLENSASNLRGYSLNLVILDEASKQRDPSASLWSSYQSAASIPRAGVSSEQLPHPQWPPVPMHDSLLHISSSASSNLEADTEDYAYTYIGGTAYLTADLPNSLFRWQGLSFCYAAVCICVLVQAGYWLAVMGRGCLVWRRLVSPTCLPHRGGGPHSFQKGLICNIDTRLTLTDNLQKADV